MVSKKGMELLNHLIARSGVKRCTVRGTSLGPYIKLFETMTERGDWLDGRRLS